MRYGNLIMNLQALLSARARWPSGPVHSGSAIDNVLVPVVQRQSVLISEQRS